MRIFNANEEERQRQFDYWFEVVERLYAPCEGFADHSQGFDARLQLAELGECELTEVFTQTSRYVRSSRHVKIGQRDDVFLELILTGETRFRQNDRCIVQRPGDILIFDTARPYEFDYPVAYDAILLRVSRPLIERRLLDSRDIGGTFLRADGPHSRMVGSIMRSLMELGHADELTAGFM